MSPDRGEGNVVDLWTKIGVQSQGAGGGELRAKGDDDRLRIEVYNQGIT